MRTSLKIVVILGVVAAAAATVVLKNSRSRNAAESTTAGAAAVNEAAAPGASEPTEKLPKLVDLGATKCIPCKMMAPILEELKKEYAGRMTVEFIDVWENEDAGEEYGVEIIPTQIFYDADGKELFRHTGFFAKEDILAKWRELGVDLSGGKPSVGIMRELPVAVVTHPPESVCFMGEEGVDAKTRSTIRAFTTNEAASLDQQL